MFHSRPFYIIVQFPEDGPCIKGRMYSPLTRRHKEEYLLESTMLALRRLLCQYFKSAELSLSDEVWEEFLFDQLAYFSMAFDFNHASRRRFNKKPEDAHPEYLDSLYLNYL